MSVKNRELNSSRKSIKFYADFLTENDPIIESQPDYMMSFYPGMFIQDVEMGIMPYSGSKWVLNAYMDPKDDEIEELISKLIHNERFSNNYYKKSLSESLNDFIRKCAHQIMAFGEAVYEIVYFSDPDTNKIIELKLVSIFPNTVKWQENKLFQYIPQEIANELKKPQYIELDPKKIVFFKPQEDFEWEKIMKSLELASVSPIPLNIIQSQGYHDFNKHKFSQKLAVAQIIKEIGWNARFSFQDEILEFYELIMLLRFEKFKISLRDEIISTLNTVLLNIGKKIGFENKLIIEGLPKLDDVKIIENDLKSGNRNFKDIVKEF